MDEVRAEAKQRWRQAQQAQPVELASQQGRSSGRVVPEGSSSSSSAQGPPEQASPEGSDGLCLPAVAGVGGCFVGLHTLGSSAVLLLLGGGGAFLATRRPCEASFAPYFETWFHNEYFPKISQRLQKELAKRAESQSFLNSLTSQFRGWVLGNTEALHAAVWYEFCVKNALPPDFNDYVCFRTATVNLGSQARPCLVTFWGAGERWFLPPWAEPDLVNVSLLDEIDGRWHSGS